MSFPAPLLIVVLADTPWMEIVSFAEPVSMAIDVKEPTGPLTVGVLLPVHPARSA